MLSPSVQNALNAAREWRVVRDAGIRHHRQSAHAIHGVLEKLLGLGLRIPRSAQIDEHRQLVLHLETLGVPAGVLDRILAEGGTQ